MSLGGFCKIRNDMFSGPATLTKSICGGFALDTTRQLHSDDKHPRKDLREGWSVMREKSPHLKVRVGKEREIRKREEEKV